MKALNISPSEPNLKFTTSNVEPVSGNIFATVKKRTVDTTESVTSTINLVAVPQTKVTPLASSTDVGFANIPVTPNTEQIIDATRTYLLKQMPLVLKKAVGVAGNKDMLKKFIKDYLHQQKSFPIKENAIPILLENITNELVGLGVLDKILSENPDLQKIHCIGTDIWIYETSKSPYKYNIKLSKNEANSFINKLQYIVECSQKNEQLSIQGAFTNFTVSGVRSEDGKDASFILTINQPLEEIRESEFISSVGSAVTLDLIKATLKSKKGVLVTGGSETSRLQFIDFLTSILDNNESIQVVKRLAAYKLKEKFMDKPISYLSVEEMEQNFKNEGTVSVIHDFNNSEIEHLLSLGNQGRTIIATLNTPTFQSTLNRLQLMGAKSQSLNETLVSKLIENTFKIHIQLDSDTHSTLPKIQCISEIVNFDAKTNSLVVNELFSLELDMNNILLKDGSFPTMLIKRNGLSESLLKTFLIKGVFTENMYEITNGEIAKKLQAVAMVSNLEEKTNEDAENNFFHFEEKGEL